MNCLCLRRLTMIERKEIGICEECEHFQHTFTKMNFPIYMCELERRKQKIFGNKDAEGFCIWHKLSTFLYPEPPSDCPFLTEHFVATASEDIRNNLDGCHARLGFGRR